MQEATINTSFTEWATEAEPKIRQSLTAAFGVQVGKDAAALAWERWDRVSVMNNPIGYVYGIGRNKARRMKTRRQPMVVEVPGQLLPNVEPGLLAAVADLPERQRITVALLHGYG